MNMKKAQTGSRRAARWSHGDLNRNWSTCPCPSTATARHATRPRTSPAPEISVGPARAKACDPARPVASRASPERAGHGLLVHHRFDQDRPGQHAETRRQLTQHQRSHL
uniref:Uncharacterized protein n=1 Tax=Rhizophora mucronata TaxID=61149 RepID=A0A2P2Q3C0_RHIMU